MQSLDKDLIKESLTLDDIRAILRDLGSEEPILDDKGNLIAQTICHHGSKFKLYYYPDSRMFRQAGIAGSPHERAARGAASRSGSYRSTAPDRRARQQHAAVMAA